MFSIQRLEKRPFVFHPQRARVFCHAVFDPPPKVEQKERRKEEEVRRLGKNDPQKETPWICNRSRKECEKAAKQKIDPDIPYYYPFMQQRK